MPTERTSDGARTLDRPYYTSPEIFALEGERIFQRNWLCVGLAVDLPDPGSYFVVELEGESLIVVRGRDRVIRAFYNVCRHRGTRLCAAASGQLGKHIVCPYHAWTYDLTGALVSAPNMNEVDGFDSGELPLHTVSTAEWEGLILVNVDPSATAFDVALAPLVGKFDRWRLSDLVSVHRTQYEVAANWKLIFQNYSECYHCPSLHRVLSRLTPYRDSSNDLEEGPVLGGPMRLSEGNDSMTMDGRACAPLFACLSEAERRLVYYYVVFPSFFLSVMPDYALIHRVRRIAPARTVVQCDWLFHPDAVASPGFDPSGAVEFWDMTNREDWAVSEQSQLGIQSRVYGPGPYSSMESMVAAFDRAYLRGLGSHAT